MQKNIGNVYVDLDGVIAGCDEGTAIFNNVSLEEFRRLGWNNPYWDNMVKNANAKDFFSNLPWEENGVRLLRWFKENNISYTFLTRPLREPNTAKCIEGKKIWLKKHNLKMPVIFEFDKEKYAISEDGKQNILIDDHSGNIEKWIAAGGIGIHYRWYDCDKVLNRLDSLLEPIVERRI